MFAFLLCPLMVGRERKKKERKRERKRRKGKGRWEERVVVFLSFLIKALIPSWGLNLSTSQSPYLQIPSNWRIGLQHMNFEWKQTFIPSHASKFNCKKMTPNFTFLTEKKFIYCHHIYLFIYLWYLQMWELIHKEGWAPKNWYFWTVMLEKTLQGPLDCKKIKPVTPKRN